MATAQPGGPTVRRILLGTELRRLREAAGLTREQAGYPIRASGSKMSRLELGQVGIKERDIADLLTLYGVTDEAERAALLDLARQANTVGWLHQYNDVMPDWFRSYVGLEEAAARIRTYHVQFVPGLLQIESYARAVTTIGHTEASQEEIEQRVRLRMARQQVLIRPEPPQLWAVIDEAALRRPIGGRRAMRAQIARLIEVAAWPHVTVQVLPFRAGGHAAESGTFTHLRFGEPDLPDVIYIEQLTGALYLDKRDDVDEYAKVMEQLSVDSATPQATRELLDRIRRET